MNILKRLHPVWLMGTMMLVVFFAVRAFAQDIPLPPTTSSDVFESIIALIGGSKGASTLAVVGMAVQLLMKFILSPLWDGLKLDPKWKFLVFALLSIAGAVVPLMVSGQSLVAAVTSGAVLLLLMQYGHRVYELFFESKPAA